MSLPAGETAPLAAFAGQAFLASDAGRLRALAAEIGALEFERVLAGDPLELEREYVRLFLAPEGAPCPPWQSVHGDPPQLMGDSHHSALAWYRSEGVEPHLGNEPADHAGLLLTFYARLLELGAPPERIAEFRRQHLAWLLQFSDGLLRHARHPFYRLLAELTRQLAGEG
jgi:TorA maturation chaperone TorD